MSKSKKSKKKNNKIWRTPGWWRFGTATTAFIGVGLVGVSLTLAGLAASKRFVATYYSAEAYHITSKSHAHPCGPYKAHGRNYYTARTASGKCPRDGVTI